MREAASRGFFLGSKAPFGYTRVKVSDGVKERPTLEIDPDAAPIVQEIFESSRRGNGLKEICKELNGRGITIRGKRWQKSTVHNLLTNEAYTGTAVWGVKSKDGKAGEPVRVENAWPTLVSRETFDAVQSGMHQRAPTQQRPARVGSQYLLSGLLRCGVCGKPYSGQAAKSGKFAYYVCASLLREGAGSCTGRYLNAERVEDYIVEKVRERILTEETITELVTLVAEEIDALAGEVNGRLKAIDAELTDVDTRLENLYQALETKQLPIEVLSPRIMSLKARQDQLVAAREEAEDQLERRRADLPTSKEIKGYVADFREFLQEGTFPERKALIRNFVKGIEIVDDEATLTYTIPMPQDGATRESASVLDFVQSGPPLSSQLTLLKIAFRAESSTKRFFVSHNGRLNSPPSAKKRYTNGIFRPIRDGCSGRRTKWTWSLVWTIIAPVKRFGATAVNGGPGAMAEQGILDGVRVLSLEQVHALPWGTGFLADLGADVIRVESPDHLQDRKAGPFPEGTAGEEWWNEAGNMVYYGARNKRSLCMVVTHPRGKEVFLKLVEKADIVTDNFRPGTMQRFGFDHDSLSAINPRIITLSSTAYGYTGPWRRAGSRARTVDAACGLSYLTGYEGGPSQRASPNYMDHSVGNNVAYALLLALYQRNKTGKGMRVDLTMLETGVSAVGPAILEAQRGITRDRLGCAHWWKAPHNVYPARGNDRWIVIVVSSETEWESLKEAMGRPQWAEGAKFGSALARWHNRHELDELIGNWTSQHDDLELARKLQELGIAAGSAMTAQDLVNDSHLRERGYMWEFSNPQAPAVGSRIFAGRPYRDPGNPMSIEKVAGLGQDNAAILAELAGLSPAEIGELESEGVVYGAPRPDESRP